jgi:hypothetical protein
MPHHDLIPHPDLPIPEGVTISIEWAMEAACLAIDYRVDDPSDSILWPRRARGRKDNLWQHTCFEAFVCSSSGSSYAEFNLSPSGAWAAYTFDDYRGGMRQLHLAADPIITHVGKGHWQATVDLSSVYICFGASVTRLAITAVIEAKDGRKSYWSLAHPPGKPDFHHADCFAARLG